jgi:hypothetical protein
MKRSLCVYLLALVAISTHLTAQINPYKDGTPGVTGYRSEVLAEVMIQEDKFLRLADAIPADKFNWRPAPDVRSFAEVFLHVSAANYNLYKLVGTPPPSTVDLKILEKFTTDKAKVIATLKAARTPNAAFCYSSSATPPSTSANPSPTRVSSESCPRGPKTPKKRKQNLRPRRT